LGLGASFAPPPPPPPPNTHTHPVIDHIITLFGTFPATMLYHQVVYVNEYLTLMAIAYNVYKILLFVNSRTFYELNQAFNMI